MKKILGLSTLALAGVLAFTGCSCNKGMSEEEALKYAEEQGYVKITAPAELPAARKDSCKANDYSATCSSITAANLKDYLGRDDVYYVDVRNAFATKDVYKEDANGTHKEVNKKYVALTAEELTSYEGKRYSYDYTEVDSSTFAGQHLNAFENVEFFNYVYGTGYQLFYEVEAGKGVFAPRYENSVEVLEGLFPKDKTLFIMCQSGGRVGTLMKILDQFGWDMSKVYNVGGMNDYKSDDYDYVTVNEEYKYTVKTGNSGDVSVVQGTTLNISVKVLVGADNKIGGVYLDSTSVYASDSYKEQVEEDVKELANSLVGSTVTEAKAKVNGETVAEGADVITGATKTTYALYKAVANALA